MTCDKPATHSTMVGDKPLCAEHASRAKEHGMVRVLSPEEEGSCAWEDEPGDIYISDGPYRIDGEGIDTED